MLALRDKDPQGIISSSAWALLYRLVPALGQLPSSDLFSTHRQQEINKIDVWWKNELNGKHMAQYKQPPPSIESNDVPTNLFAELSSPNLEIRQQAISKLNNTSNNGNLPCLLLGLQDPDMDISYSSYVLIHKIVLSLGATASEDDYKANLQDAQQPIYDWWTSKYLRTDL